MYIRNKDTFCLGHASAVCATVCLPVSVYRRIVCVHAYVRVCIVAAAAAGYAYSICSINAIVPLSCFQLK